MIKSINDEEYLSIIDSIIKNKEFDKMNYIKHHNTTRMDHSLKVSYYSYKIAKSLKLDYIEVARGGLLHDFYLGTIAEESTVKDKLKLYSVAHPKEAVKNSKMNFNITDKEEDIIKSHMFPVDFKIPKYAESWIVSFVDKGVSINEFAKKFSYKLSYIVNLYLILFLNIRK